jgi:tetratricopeptide (TPR) repeat protein
VGDLYGELNQHAEAHAAYQLAFAALPAGADADRALLGMASNYLAWGKGPEAVQAFRHLKEQARSETVRAVATFGLADALHALKHEQEAYHWYEAGTRRWPTWLKQRPQSLVGFAEAARALGQRDRARDLLLLMINLYPRAPEAPLAGLALGDLLTETGARASAVLFYGEVMRRYAGSLAEAAAQVRLVRLGREWARHTPAARSERGVGSGKTVDLVRFLDGAERRRVLRRVAEQYSDDRLASEALVELGVEWEAAGRWEEALRIYRELADRTGRLLDDPWPEVGKRRLRELVSPRLTQALKAQNDLDAVNLFQQYAVSASGESLVEPELLLKIAGAHRRLGFTAQAVKWYQAILQDPSARSLGEEALIGLGASYLDQDDPDAARQVFQRYRLQYPAGRWVAEAWQQLAVIALDKGEQAVAIDLARRWLVRFPQHPARGQVWLVLARALEGRAQLKEALEAYAQADRAGALSEHTPLAPATARLHYASLLFQVGRTDEAIRQLEGARRASTDPILSDWARFELARALLAQHKEKQARTLLTALGESSVDELVGRVSRLLLKEDEQLANGGEAP